MKTDNSQEISLQTILFKDVDVDGCGTDVSVMVNAMGPSVDLHTQKVLLDEIEKTKKKYDGEWDTDTCVEAAIKKLKKLGYCDICVVAPSAEIDF